ncbi:MAG: hypothetical protein LBC86_00715, partial [Oscillospiraceae bacterium]|nr:hypothetical protein [Oscillospiraceae bacterium]
MKKRILAMFVAVVVIFGVIQTVTASNTTLQTPIITMQPVSANYLLNATPTSLSVDAYVTDGGALTYQWYSNPVNSNIGGIAIEGATNPSLIPSTTGTHDSYYYVVVTNTNGDNEPTLTTSNVAAIYFERELGKFNATSNWGYYAWYHLYSAGDFTHSNSGIELTFGMLRNAVELRIEFTEEPAGDIMFAYAFHSHPHIKIFGSGHGTSLVFNFSLPTLNWHEATSDNFGHIGTTLALMYSENHDLREIIESATLVYKGS